MIFAVSYCLQSMYFWGNKLTGTLPPEYSNLDNLQVRKLPVTVVSNVLLLADYMQVCGSAGL